MSRTYCVHLMPDEFECDLCIALEDAEAQSDYWATARAWSGLAMWCSCLMDYRNNLRDFPSSIWPHDERHVMRHTTAEITKSYWQGWHAGNESAKTLTSRKLRMWQSFRDWLNGTGQAKCHDCGAAHAIEAMTVVCYPWCGVKK